MKITKREIFSLISGLIVLVSGLAIFADGIFKPFELYGQGKIFGVEKGESLWQIGQNLEKEKLIKNHWFFDIAVFLESGARKLQAGDYRFSQAMTPLEMAKKIISGDIAKEILTIPEGWNIRDIDYYLKTRGFAQDNEFLQASNEDYSAEFSFLKDKPKNLNLEGFLFPDTYEFSYGFDNEEIVRKMLDNFDKKLTPDLRTEIKKQGKTIFEIVTMASLLEEEVKTIEDKKIVAGILWKRLKIGMPLQVDATILYALGNEPRWLTYDDLKIDSLYNTYKYVGLPPGPIANPGLDSIMAAIYPQKSGYWYYLSAPDGKTYFSQTLEEHNLKKVKYLK